MHFYHWYGKGALALVWILFWILAKCTLLKRVSLLRMEISFRLCFAMGFPFSNKNKMFQENVNPIPMKKIYFRWEQITYILTQNDNAVPVHFKFFRVYCCIENVKKNLTTLKTLVLFTYTTLIGIPLVFFWFSYTRFTMDIPFESLEFISKFWD